MFQTAIVAPNHDTVLKILAEQFRDAGKPQEFIITVVARKLTSAHVKARQTCIAHSAKEIQSLEAFE
ncbi:hypothetical protein [Ruegeria sp. R14_0]|uniref:hypothetical protein n=1 Tax=Ruegeria sp. R14_0 TaxID=2821100 RepID=UPI001ADB6BC6|nr:hypothetical protein [Ruegeria sp. R14_0]MBO9448550.1 hypothetical protein [Ruegeria sp. R14_0]